MHNRPLLVSLLLVVLPVTSVAAPAVSADEQAWFQRTLQSLYDAVAAGDKGPWQTYLAEDCIYTGEDGDIQTKAQLLDGLSPLPPGFSGKITIRDLKLQPVGEAVVVARYLSDETEDVFGQHLHTRYLSTDTWRRAGGGWRMVASQVTVVPRDLDEVKVDPSGFTALAGDYRLSPDSPRRYHVYLRGGALYGGSDEKSATRLIPLSPLVFFQAGSIHTMIFVPDGKGAIAEVREVHKYNELTYSRVP